MSEKKVLIIDDHGALRYILSFDLQKKGFKTISAGTGEKGIEMASVERPDIILLDAKMPDIDGFETCRRLRAINETKGIPVVIMLSNSQQNNLTQGLGSVVEIVKPFKFDELLNKIIATIGAPESKAVE